MSGPAISRQRQGCPHTGSSAAAARPDQTGNTVAHDFGVIYCGAYRVVNCTGESLATIANKMKEEHTQMTVLFLVTTIVQLL
ncbi:hypothetical protein BRADI_3g12841v3 [Brachypodium distachyon]|uniref:Uncharacterized protein n=1 Tax=Brachypodium distachyon TaxID=15368 RepID=A0A2K2CWS3_BRADI|nr:hypothetical protein BRADI_3g12841v3 [Brachypodium distachyon]